MRKSERERYIKIIEQDDRRVARLERTLEKALRTKENKDVARFERLANREMGEFDKETKRDYW